LLEKRAKQIVETYYRPTKNFAKIDRLGGGFGTSRGLKCPPQLDPETKKLNLVKKKLNFSNVNHDNEKIYVAKQSKMLNLNLKECGTK
jgi:hypothetical protein